MSDDDYQETLDAAIHQAIGDPPTEGRYRDYLAFNRALTAYEVHKRRATRELRARLPRTPLAQIGKRPTNGKDH